MLPIYISPQQDNPALRENYFDYAQSGTMDVLGATFGQAFYENPMNALIRSTSLYFGGDIGRKLTPQEYRESSYYRDGISVDDDGIYEGAASMLAERFDVRERRKLILSRSRGGVGLGVSQFGVGLVASMLDPINIGSAFIPGLAASRFGLTLSRATTTATRLRRGAVEGAIGAAAVEPIVYGAAKLEQDADYTLADSMLNVTFGTVLGGGLHAVGGRIGDALTRTKPATREALLKTALAQTADGRRVEVQSLVKADPVLRNDPAFRGANVVDESIGETPELDMRPKGNKKPDVLKPLSADRKSRPQTIREFIRSIGGVRRDDPNASDVREAVGNDSLLRRAPRRKGKPLPPEQKALDKVREAAEEAGYLREGSDINDLLNLIREDTAETPKFSERETDFAIRLETAKAIDEELKKYGIDPTGYTDEQIAQLLEARQRVDDIPEDIPDGMTEQEFYQLRKELQEDIDRNPDVDEFIDRMREAQEIEARFDAEPLKRLQEENELLEEDIRYLIDEELLDDAAQEQIQVFNRLTEKSEEGYDKALQAAQICLTGKL